MNIIKKLLISIIVVIVLAAIAGHLLLSQLSKQQLADIINKQIAPNASIAFDDKPIIKLIGSPTLSFASASLTLHSDDPQVIDLRRVSVNLDWHTLTTQRQVVLDKILASTGRYGSFNGNGYITPDYKGFHIQGTQSQIQIFGETVGQLTGWAYAPFTGNQYQGEFDLRSTDLRLKGIDIDHTLCTTASRVTRKRGRIPSTNTYQTLISDLKAKAVIEGDRVTLSGMSGKTNQNQITGSGIASIKNQSATFDLILSVGNRQYCSAISTQLADIQWPLTCDVSLASTDATCGLNKVFLKDLFKAQLERSSKNELDKMMNKLFKKK